MQIFVTEKLAMAADLPLEEEEAGADPLSSWTAGWYETRGWQHPDEDTLIAVNNAARFVIAVYPVLKENLAEVLTSFPEMIRHALEAEGYNPVLIEKYLADLDQGKPVRSAGKQNTERLDDVRDLLEKDFPCWLAPSRFEAPAGSGLLGRHVNFVIEQRVQEDPEVKWKQPALSLADALSDHYGLPAFRYSAFAIDCSLDLIRYQAIRRIVVPADLSLPRMHVLLQYLYDWDDEHLHAFYAGRSRKSRICYISDECDLDYNDWPEQEYTVRDLYAKGMGNHAVYEYDFGDSWQVDLHLVKRLRHDDRELPRQLSAEGQSPLEDSGGSWGFAHLLDVLDNPDDPDYDMIKEWVGDWSPELPEQRKGERELVFY